MARVERIQKTPERKNSKCVNNFPLNRQSEHFDAVVHFSNHYSSGNTLSRKQKKSTSIVEVGSGLASKFRRKGQKFFPGSFKFPEFTFAPLPPPKTIAKFIRRLDFLQS